MIGNTIKRLDWDSAFFGFPIGKCDMITAKNFSEELFKENSKHFKLTYIFTPHKLNCNNNDIKLVDTKLVYVKNVNNLYPSDLEPEYFNSSKHDYNQLLELAFLSGKHSRFRLDSNFPALSFERLYQIWLDKSIKKENIKVIVEFNKNKITGFITLELQNNGFGKIGLIAVNPEFQGQGIGSKLLNKSEFLTHKAGKDHLEVATQQSNKAATQLYQKNAFIGKQKLYVYHYWNV